MTTIAEQVDGELRDSRLEVKQGRYNPYTNLVHWKDGSISKVVRSMGKMSYKLHDIGTKERMARRCPICGKNEGCKCPETGGYKRA